MVKYVEVQVESLDEGVVDSLKVPFQKVIDFLNKAKINIKDKLSPDKKKIILNAAEVAIMFLPSLNSKLSSNEIKVLENLDNEPPEKIASITFKMFKELSNLGYINEDEKYFIIPRKMLRNSSIAGYKARANLSLQKGELINRIRESDKKLELTTSKLTNAQKELDIARQRYNEIEEALDKVKVEYTRTYLWYKSKESESIKLKLKLEAKKKALAREKENSQLKAAEVKKLEDSLKAEKERARDAINVLKEERNRLREELAKYQGDIESYNKEISKYGKEVLANKLEIEDLRQQLTGKTPSDGTEMSEAVAETALISIISNCICTLVGMILASLLGKYAIDSYYEFQREALKVNKKVFTEFDVGPAGVTLKTEMGENNMTENNVEFDEEVNEEVIDMEDCLVFDESDIESLYSEDDIDESIIDGAISKARLLKKLYKLFATGAIRVTGSKIIIDTEKIGGQENA